MKNSCYSPQFGKKDIEAKSQQGPATNEWKNMRNSGPRLIYTHAFHYTPFNAKPTGAPNSFPHVLCPQYDAKMLYASYALTLALSPYPCHPTDKCLLFHHHQQEVQCPFAPRSLQMEASPSTSLTAPDSVSSVVSPNHCASSTQVTKNMRAPGTPSLLAPHRTSSPSSSREADCLLP